MWRHALLCGVAALVLPSLAHAQINLGNFPSASSASGRMVACPIQNVDNSTELCTPGQIATAAGSASQSTTISAGIGLTGGGSLAANLSLSLQPSLTGLASLAWASGNQVPTLTAPNTWGLTTLGPFATISTQVLSGDCTGSGSSAITLTCTKVDGSNYGSGVINALQNAVNTSSGFLTGSSAASYLGIESAAYQPTTAFDAAGAAATAQSTAISTAEAFSLGKANNLSDLPSASTARTNLGLNGTGFAAAAANPVNTTGGLVTYGGSIGTPTINISAATGLTASQVNTAIGGSPLLLSGGTLTGAVTGTTLQLTGIGLLANSALEIANTGGGAWYMSNTATGATTPNKYFRIGSLGDLQILNSAYSSVIFDLSDAGLLNLPQVPIVNGANLVINANGTNCLVGYVGTVTACTISTTGATLAAGSTTTSGFSNGQVLYSDGTHVQPLSTTGTGSVVLNSTLSSYATTSSLSAYATTSSLSAYALLSGATFTGPVNGTLASFSGSGWQYFLGNTGSAFPAGTAAGGLSIAWNVTSGQAEVDFLNRTNLGDPSGFAFYQQPSGSGTPTQIAYLGATEDTFPEPIYGTGSTNTLSCPVNFDSNGPTAEFCAITSTTASGNKSQWGWMISNTSNAVSTSGAEAGGLYVANNCLSGAPKCWGMALTNVSEAGSAGGQALEMISANGSCDPGLPWHPTTSCTTPTSGMLIDGIGNSTANVYAGEAAIYIVNSSAGAIFHAGMFIGNNSGGASSVDQCAVCDYSGDYSVMRAGGTHTHFYYPDPTYTPVSYTSTMWDGELTIGDSSESGPMISVANSTATCVGSPSTGAFGWSCSSDARLKTDYGPDGDELAYINSLPIDRYKVNATGEITVGPIAQKLQKVHPEMVHEVEDDLIPADKENAAGTMLSADQPNIWKLTRGIQEVWSHDLDQDAEIAALKALTRRQQSQIAALSSGARRTPANDNGVLGFLRHLIAR